MTGKTSVIPTTVSIESTEKSRFIPTMTATTSPKLSVSLTVSSSPLAFTRSSFTPFQIRMSPPRAKITAFPLKAAST